MPGPEPGGPRSLLADADREDVELPYDFPLTKYGVDDRPWIVDEQYLQPDAIGERWTLN